MPSRRGSRRSSGLTDQWMQYIRGNVAESAANTFTQVTINMPVVVAKGLVVQAHSIEWSIPGPDAAGEISATDDQLRQRCQLTKTSQTTILALDDPNLISAYDVDYWAPAARTAEGKPVLPATHVGNLYMHFPEPILLPFEQIFFAAQGTGEGEVHTYRFRLGFTTVQLATSQLVELIQAVT